MTYAVSAITSDGTQISVHSTSVAAIRAALSEAHQQQATSIDITNNGKEITEAQLSETTLAALISGGTTTKMA